MLLLQKICTALIQSSIFVFSSVIGTQLNKLLNHACKRPTEEALLEGGLLYTILRPGHRMDMLLLKKIGVMPTK